MDNSTQAVWKHGMFFVRSCFGVLGYSRRPLGEILSVGETLEQLRGLDNVTSAYIHKAVSSNYTSILIQIYFQHSRENSPADFCEDLLVTYLWHQDLTGDPWIIYSG